MSRKLSEIELLYTAENGEVYSQPLADITNSGTLIDPESGEDLDLTGWQFMTAASSTIVDPNNLKPGVESLNPDGQVHDIATGVHYSYWKEEGHFSVLCTSKEDAQLYRFIQDKEWEEIREGITLPYRAVSFNLAITLEAARDFTPEERSSLLSETRYQMGVPATIWSPADFVDHFSKDTFTPEEIETLSIEAWKRFSPDCTEGDWDQIESMADIVSSEHLERKA